MGYIDELGKNAKVASQSLVKLGTTEKNQILGQVADALLAETDYILTENARDVDQAQENGISPVVADRLRPDAKRIEGIAESVRRIADLQDPIGQVVRGYTNLDGLKIVQKRVPPGVATMIFESRPNVSVDAFNLVFKTSNAITLRSGCDTICSNTALATIIRKALAKAGVNENVVQLVEDISHVVTEELMQAVDYVDVLIPRGGARLIQTVKKKSKVPVIEIGVGDVHIYVDDSADPDMVTKIVINARTQRPSVCNAIESLFVHKTVAKTFLPQLGEAIAKVHAAEFRADDKALAIFKNAVAATDEDYGTEFSDYVMSVKVIDFVDNVIDWVNRYTTYHSKAITTKDLEHAERSQDEVDAAVVYVNTSTRFTDGFVSGLGAEIGISTQKVHARGPMGLEALISTKFYINGRGQVRE